MRVLLKSPRPPPDVNTTSEIVLCELFPYSLLSPEPPRVICVQSCSKHSFRLTRPERIQSISPATLDCAKRFGRERFSHSPSSQKKLSIFCLQNELLVFAPKRSNVSSYRNNQSTQINRSISPCPCDRHQYASSQ